ncbi:hypothetical protein SASPL_128477 [Salvia splendens]|uniref:Alpha-L-fucosidase n=1 Tax=Salvia splendens TaxID=180675 RepID=A0A8X8XE61_SALSN|nr:hypothetical protein SASPL_128477 [Salvia splendens]
MEIAPIFFILLKNIYAFGDSYTDTGNTHSNSGPSGFMFVSNLPYGRTFFHRPTNRYSDGRLVIDFVAPVAAALSRPHVAIDHGQRQLRGRRLDGHRPQLLREEQHDAQHHAAVDLDAAGLDALIWVGEIGANDYAYSFGSSVPSQSIQNLAINSVTAFLQALMKKGAKYVVVQGLPSTGCLTLSMYLAPPNDRDIAGCVGTANKQSSSHNTVLKPKRDQQPKSHGGITEPYKVCCGHGGGAYNFDYLNACGSPSASSCGTPTRYINWDGVHLTEAMNRAMANAFLNETYAQPPFTHLLARKHKSSA